MMGKRPAVFVSSTIQDFRDLRSAIKYYLEKLGYEVFLSEQNDFPKALDKNTYEACLRTIERADYYILLIGSRVGAFYDAPNRISITRMEYRKAYKLACNGRLRILAFLRDELWKIREDRKALALFLESKSSYLGLSCNERRSITSHPSPLMTDAEAISSFIDEVSRQSEMKAAVEGQSPFPGANWIYSFTTFRDIVDVLRVHLGISDTLVDSALKANLRREILENSALLMEKGKHGIRPAYVWASYARRCFDGSLGDRSRMPGKYLRWLVAYSVTTSRGRKLSTRFLDQALASGRFLKYDTTKASYEFTPFTDRLFQLREQIERLRTLCLDLQTNITDFVAKHVDRAKTDGEVDVCNDSLVFPLVIADEEENIVRLSTAILRALNGDVTALDPLVLNPLTPIKSEGEQIAFETVTAEEVEDWLAAGDGKG